ncbi:MAG: putative DNA binding domain-containing protein [Sphingobacteriia bacterium]|nr:putative DNA binding domain-containing protein [Sphingobacteriia bacterium]
MNTVELLDIVSTRETSKVQFKQELPNRESVAQELVAMSNSLGGVILLGIKDVTGEVVGLSSEQIEEYDKVVSQIADNIKPIVYITTEVIRVDKDKSIRNVLVVNIQEGINKPYKTARGEIYVKQGSNKRLLTDNSEIMRLFQQSSNLLVDEMEVFDTTIDDIDERLFADYFKREFKVSYQEKGLTYEEALRAKRVLRKDKVSLAGLLFFGKEPQSIKPAFTIKAVSFFGNDIAGSSYRNKPEDFKGTIPELFKQSMNFLRSSLLHTQQEQEFHSVGVLEISEIVLTELIQNALVHRDYLKNAPIKIMIFDDRVEIVSPGKLPNSLTIEEIKFGNTVIRNNQIAMFAIHSMPYSGLGSGIKRALAQQPDIELINDVNGEQFIVRIPRMQDGLTK